MIFKCFLELSMNASGTSLATDGEEHAVIYATLPKGLVAMMFVQPRASFDLAVTYKFLGI